MSLGEFLQGFLFINTYIKRCKHLNFVVLLKNIRMNEAKIKAHAYDDFE
jgi:hypothetical protein